MDTCFCSDKKKMELGDRFSAHTQKEDKDSPLVSPHSFKSYEVFVSPSSSEHLPYEGTQSSIMPLQNGQGNNSRFLPTVTRTHTAEALGHYKLLS